MPPLQCGCPVLGWLTSLQLLPVADTRACINRGNLNASPPIPLRPVPSPPRTNPPVCYFVQGKHRAGMNQTLLVLVQATHSVIEDRLIN